MTTPEFGTIAPAPASDWFQFDITNQIGNVSPSATITSVQWTCGVSPESDDLVSDTNPMSHILDNDHTTTTASVLAGNFIDGVTYTLTAIITMSDQRVFVRFADLLCSLRPDVEQDVPLTVENFRAQFPAFSDPAMYPSEQIDYWIYQAETLPPINPYRIGQFYDIALRYWIAHNLTMQRWAANQALGGSPALGVGVPGSKSVNGVSISYDNSLGVNQDAGPYNLTYYGQMFYYYLEMAGAAGNEVPTGYPAGTVFNGLGTIMPYALGYSW